MPNKKKGLQDLLYDLRRIEAHREVLTENKIKAMYRQLNKDLDHFLADAYKEYADEDGRLYVSYLDKNRKRAWFLKEIAERAGGIEPEIEKELLSLVEKTYSSCYKGMAQAVKSADTGQKLKEVTKDISVQPNVLKQAVNNNISKLTLPPVLQKHRGELIAQIQQELTIGLMNGDRYEKMAKRISERTGVSQSKAMNIVRTESHRNAESGFMDCAENIQEGLEGSDLIYAATWITMEDERVRPNVVRKTKKGWKQGKNSNGANHVILHGQTVKAGELFDLKDGVKAKAPSMSGVAAHDCNCRCEVEYNLMTVEEFAKATGQREEQVREKYKLPQSHKLGTEEKTELKKYECKEDKESVERVAERIKQELGITNVDLSELKNDTVLSPFIDQTIKLQSKQNVRYNGILADKNMVGTRDIAQVAPSGKLHINPDFFNSEEAMRDILKEFTDKKLIPKGNASIEYIAKHEYIHLLTIHEIDDPKSLARTLFRRAKGTDFISLNAVRDPYEFVADTLSADIDTSMAKKLRKYYGIGEEND